MAAASFIDACRFLPTAGGTSAFVYSSAVGGYQSPALAGAVNGATYRYRAESADLTQWEIGYGAYTVSTTTLTRATVLYNSSGTGSGSGQSGAGSLINFSTVPQVAIIVAAEDMGPLGLKNATSQAQPSTPTGTTSTTQVMAGLGGCSLTPVYSGRILVMFKGSMYSSVAGAAAYVQTRYGTGTAPANGSSAAGYSAVDVTMAATSPGANAVLPFTSGGIVTGLTPGTAYWFDLAIQSSSGSSTANYTDLTFTAIEF